jgi:hypothetical protein
MPWLSVCRICNFADEEESPTEEEVTGCWRRSALHAAGASGQAAAGCATARPGGSLDVSAATEKTLKIWSMRLNHAQRSDDHWFTFSTGVSTNNFSKMVGS